VFAADQACDNHVGFPSLSNANTTVDVGVNKAFTVPANHAPVLGWQSQFGSHGDSARYSGVTLRQLWFFSDFLLSQTKEHMNALQRYLSGFIHYLFVTVSAA